MNCFICEKETEEGTLLLYPATKIWVCNACPLNSERIPDLSCIISLIDRRFVTIKNENRIK